MSHRFDEISIISKLPLLPGDVKHVHSRLQAGGFESSADILRRYREVWEREAAAEADENKKDNSGRRAANIFLMDLTKDAEAREVANAKYSRY